MALFNYLERFAYEYFRSWNMCGDKLFSHTHNMIVYIYRISLENKHNNILWYILLSHVVDLTLSLLLDHKKCDYSPGNIVREAGLALIVIRHISNLEQGPASHTRRHRINAIMCRISNITILQCKWYEMNGIIKSCKIRKIFAIIL
jgi:hypothetical protein